MKIDANAERGDKRAKLVVKMDLAGSWVAFGKDLGSLGFQVGAKLNQVGPFGRLLGVLGRLLGASWLPGAAKMVPRGTHGRSKNGYLVDFGSILLQILHIFIDKFPGMSVIEKV